MVTKSKDSGFFVNFKNSKINPDRADFALLNVFTRPRPCSINHIYRVNKLIVAGRCNCGKIHPVTNNVVSWNDGFEFFKKIFSTTVESIPDNLIQQVKSKWPLRMGEQEHSYIPISGDTLNVFVPKKGPKVKLSEALRFSKIFNFKMSGTYGLVVAEPILSAKFSKVNSFHGVDHFDFLNDSDHGIRVPRLDLFTDKPSKTSATFLDSFIGENEGIILFS